MRRFLLSSIAVLLSLAINAQSPVNDDADGTIIDAVSLFNDGDYNAARSLLLPLAGNGSDNDAVFYYLGMCEGYLDEIEEAEQFLSEAVRLDPDNFWYQDRLARLYSATDRPELTIDIYESLINKYPKKTDLYYTLAQLYMQQGKSDKVIETLDAIENVTGKNEMTTLARYDILMRQNKGDEAFASLAAYNEEYASPSILATMGDYKISQYEDSLALSYYNEALSYDSSFAQALLGKAETQRIRRQYDDYFKTIGTFIREESVPTETKTKYLASVLQHTDPYFLKNFLPQIDSLVDACVECSPSDTAAIQTAASYYYSTQRTEKAGEYFLRNKTLLPESLNAAAVYIQYLAYTAQWNKVITESRAASEQFPQEPAFLEFISMAGFNMKDYDLAIGANLQILESFPKDSAVVLSAYAGLGDLYHMKGEAKRAYKAYDKALKINHRYVPVLNNYAYYLSLEKKQLSKAYSMSKITIEEDPDNATYLDTFGWILYLQGKALEAKPFFKHAMLYGGKDSAVMLDHYAEVLYALKEYDLAKVYWNQAKNKNTDGAIPDLDERVKARIEAIKK